MHKLSATRRAQKNLATSCGILTSVLIGLWILHHFAEQILTNRGLM